MIWLFILAANFMLTRNEDETVKILDLLKDRVMYDGVTAVALNYNDSRFATAEAN